MKLFKIITNLLFYLLFFLQPQNCLLAQASKLPVMHQRQAQKIPLVPQMPGSSKLPIQTPQQLLKAPSTPQATPGAPGLPQATAQALQTLPPELQALFLQSKQPLPQPPAVGIVTPQLPVALAPQQKIPLDPEQAKLLAFKKSITEITPKTDAAQQQKVINDFIAEILDKALESKQISPINLSATQKTLESIIVHLKTLNTALLATPSMKDRITLTTSQIETLSGKKYDLDKKINQLNKLSNMLSDARKIPVDNLQEKVDSYTKILPNLTKDISTTYMEEFITDLHTLVTAIKGQEPPKVALVKQLLDQTTENKTLSKEQLIQIQGFISIVTGKAPIKSPQLKIVSPDEIKNKILDIQKKKTLFEKITACREFLPLLGDTTSQTEKDSFVGILRDFMQNLPTMKKAELAELRNLFDEVEKNPFLLASNQQPIMGRWLKIVTQSQLTIDNINVLFASIKKSLDTTKEEYNKQLELCNLALVILASKLPPVEMDIKNPASMASKVNGKIKFLFINRPNRTYDDLIGLQGIFGLAKQTSLASQITPEWQNDITIDLVLNESDTKRGIFEKLQNFIAIVKLLSDKIDTYERNLFITELTNIFNNRKDRAIKELEKLKELLAILTAQDFKNKKIFAQPIYAQLDTWNTILDGTLILLTPNDQKNLPDQIKIYQAVIPNITNPQANYEKNLFNGALARFFTMRGNLQIKDLTSLRDFFKMVRNVQNLLAANQIPLFTQWVQDFDNAVTITSGNKTYLEAMLESASKKQDITMFAKSLSLFTPSTNTAIINNFVSRLNELYTKRKPADSQKLLTFFKMAEQKKIGKIFLLTQAQIKVLKQWESNVASSVATTKPTVATTQPTKAPTKPTVATAAPTKPTVASTKPTETKIAAGAQTVATSK